MLSFSFSFLIRNVNFIIILVSYATYFKIWPSNPKKKKKKKTMKLLAKGKLSQSLSTNCIEPVWALCSLSVLSCFYCYGFRLTHHRKLTTTILSTFLDIVRKRSLSRKSWFLNMLQMGYSLSIYSVSTCPIPCDYWYLQIVIFEKTYCKYLPNTL